MNSQTQKKMELKKALGLSELVFYGIGIILGAGIYALIGKGAGLAGNGLWLAFSVGAFIAAFTGLSYAELGTMFPKEAAEFIYTKQAFKSKLIPFLVGWLIIAAGFVSASVVALGFGGYLEAITGLPLVAGAILLILACSFLNFLGIKESAKTNIVFTLIEILGLIIIIFLGIGHIGSVNLFEMSAGFSGIMAAAVLVFFAFIGFEDIVNLSEEAKNPIKDVPKALIISIIVSTLVYILVSICAVSILPWDKLAVSNAPLADAANAAFSGSGIFLSFIALFATANTVLIILIVESRMIWGMAKERNMPTFFSKLHSQRCTPWAAIVFIMFISILITIFWDIKSIAEVADFFVFLIFISVNGSLIILRFTEPKLKRPFKVPINIGRFPVVPAFGLVFCLYMLFYFNYSILMVGIVILASGIIAFYLMRKFRIIKA